MLLSILIISHNQKELLRRCIESVLQQNLPFEHEIIISDDSSTDGTWELARAYTEKYKQVKAFHCNSDDCNPSYNSERSGYNRSNAYNHSSGKYFCHIDADDYYRPGTNCLQEMVMLLEKHSDCSICMQADCSVDENSPLEKCWHFISPNALITGQIINARDFFCHYYDANNGSMVMRRIKNVNPANLYGKWYVDNIITTHHLQYGNIVCLKRDDWIYTHNPHSITQSLSNDEKCLIWGLGNSVIRSYLIPKFHSFYFTNDSLCCLLDAIRLILSRTHIPARVKTYCNSFNNLYVCRSVSKSSLSFCDIFRLYLIKVYIKHLLKCTTRCNWQTNILILMCNGTKTR